jgi:arylformamidase
MQQGAQAGQGAVREADFAASNQFAYIDGQLRPSHPELFARFAKDNERAVAVCGPELDLRYGPQPRQTFDLFSTPHPRRGAIAYYHAGYWQSRDKSGFRFLAPALVAAGFDVALVNYPLSPERTVGEITAATHESIPAIAALTGNAPMILAGHSAGAQLAIDLGMLARERGWAISGIMSISGVFDLAPLIGTSVNDKLGLDPAAAKAASPLHRIVPDSPPTMFVVGALETTAFGTQTEQMARAWAEAGNPGQTLIVADTDHFSILDALGAQGPLHRIITDFATVTPVS